MSLAKKLTEVTQKIEKPEKSGYLSYANHEYSTKDDLFDVMRTILADHGVDFSPSAELTHISFEGDTKAVVTVEVTLTDAETGEVQTSSWVGAAEGDDKTVAAASTQALRFWIVNKFQLSDGMVEGVYDDQTKQADQNVHREPAPPDEGDDIDDIRARLVEDLGLNPDQAAAYEEYIAQVEGCDSIAGVAPGRLSVWADKMYDKPDGELRQNVLDRIGDQQAA